MHEAKENRPEKHRETAPSNIQAQKSCKWWSLNIGLNVGTIANVSNDGHLRIRGENMIKHKNKTNELNNIKG